MTSVIHNYELLPFPSALAAAKAVSVPLTVTVTCSPKSGPDASVQIAGELRRLGHAPVVHLAARMITGPDHLDRLLEAMAEAELHDAFVIGGDAERAAGPYTSGAALLPILKDHSRPLTKIGIPSYPEGHPAIGDGVLSTDLAEKSKMADYIVTQMCFDMDAVTRWASQTREAGIDLPIYLGLPGAVDRKRLLEISMRVGVGTSIAFLRKQRSVLALMGRGSGIAEDLLEDAAPLLADDALGIDGLHFFTFNRLVETLRMVEQRAVSRSA